MTIFDENRWLPIPVRQLRLLLAELIANALDATHDLTCEQDPNTIVDVTVSLSPRDGLKIVISDNGCGFPDEMIKSKNPFSHTSVRYKDPDKFIGGANVGLLHVQKNILNLNGEIELDNIRKNGEVTGAKVFLQIPIHPNDRWRKIDKKRWDFHIRKQSGLLYFGTINDPMARVDTRWAPQYPSISKPRQSV